MRNIMLMYHPVKKEVRFFINTLGEYVEIQYENCPSLQKYSFQAGDFLLQNQGYEFFDDIVDTFLGIEHSKVIYKGTKTDYKDFLKMVKEYNKFKDKEVIKLGEFIEIPAVDVVYRDIIDFYLETMNIFENELRNKESKLIFNNRKKDLNEKIKILDKNNVNLCMVGTYSSGKSTFINAIIGKRILPEKINSETAKMFRIQNSMHKSIKFIVKKSKSASGKIASIVWDEKLNIYRFTTDINDDGIKGEIYKIINENKELLEHEQLHNIIKCLNSLPNDKNEKFEVFIDGIIDVYYPIPICKNINFTFFDTPGTDSNSDEHLNILKEALQQQTNSILAIVYSPLKMEGKGNSVLYKLLSESQEEKAIGQNVTIDLSRSLHIINQADRFDEDELLDIMDKKIKTSLNNNEKIDEKNLDEYEYDLKEKRVFYVSSKIAYCAKAKLNGISTAKDDKFLNKKIDSVLEEKYFLYNNLAKAKTETEELKKRSQEAIDNYSVIEDKEVRNLNSVIVSSGMYAIEDEIVKYANKYALAVKAKGLYDGVVFVIDGVRKSYEAIESQAKRNKEEVRKNIDIMKTKIVEDICSSYDDFEKYLNEQSMEEQLPEIESIHNVVHETNSKAKEEVEKMPKIAYKIEKFEEKNKAITKSLNMYASDIDRYYKDIRIKILQNQVSELHNIISKKIMGYKMLDEAIIKQILNVSDTKVPESILKPFIMDNYIKKKKLFIFNTTDKKEYIGDVGKKFTSLTSKQYDNYIAEIKRVAKECGSKLKDELINNIDMLSSNLENLIKNERELLKEQENARLVLQKVDEKCEELNKKLWREIHE